MKAIKFTSKLLSWFFLPLLAPVYALSIGMFVENWEMDMFQRNCLYAIFSQEAKQVLMYLFIAFSFLAPAITVAMMQIRGNVDSVMLEKRSQRIIPSILTIVYGIGLLAILYVKVPIAINGGKFIYGLALGSILAVILCTVLTFRWKVSLHAAGMGIFSGFLTIYFYHMYTYSIGILALVFLASGLVMSARMVLKLHSLQQLVVGYLIGFFGVICGCLYYL